MLNIRPNIFETNSSSADYYNEPDHWDSIRLPASASAHIKFEGEDKFLKCIEYAQNKDYLADFIEESYNENFEIKNINSIKFDQNLLSFDYVSIVDAEIWYKHGYSSSIHEYDILGIPTKELYEDNKNTVLEANEYFIKAIFDFIYDDLFYFCKAYDFDYEEWSALFDVGEQTNKLKITEIYTDSYETDVDEY